MASGLHDPATMENEKSVLDEEDVTELPDREAMTVLNPTLLGGPELAAPALDPTAVGEATTGQGMSETPTRS